MTSLAVELCAYSVAIALICRPSLPLNYQWSIDALAAELQTNNIDGDHNFRFDALALHQGLFIFRKQIEQLGCTIVGMNQKGVMKMEAFMDLAARSRGADIIFLTENSSVLNTRDNLVIEINKLVNRLLSTSYKAVSKYISISEIYGVLWLRQLRESEKANASNKRRKKGEEIGDRQMGRYGKEVYEFVSSRICAADESPTMYINAAVKESAYRSAGALEDVCCNIFNDNDDDGSVTEAQIFSHPDVRIVLRKFPNKNITFKLHGVQLVIALFDAVGTARNDLEGENYRANNTVTATHTKEILIKYARYSELVVETIVRWIVKRDVIKKTSGRKISVEFEADIWGNLMICEFEKKNVSCI